MSKSDGLEDIFGDIPGVSGNPTSKSTTGRTATAGQPSADDLLEGLKVDDYKPSERGKPSSRPHTPRVGSTSTTPAVKSSPKRPGTATPPTDGLRNSEDKAQARKSGESSRSFHTSFTPATTEEGDSPPERPTAAPEPVQQISSGGGWWGAITATASAAVKQAETLAKEIQHNEEAQRWAEQVKANAGALRGFGGELRSRALPTFTNIIHTLAPPISSHERLQIHITHDLVGYPSLDPLIYGTFSRVMAQVEGGDLLVIQRGQESKKGSEGGYTGSRPSGWSDGPWWRETSQARSLGTVKGLVEGTKLSKVSAESYASEYFASRGGLEEAAKQATEVLSETNPVRSSDIFLAIQAISQPNSDNDLFGGPSSDKTTDDSDANVVEPPAAEADDLISFAAYLHDPIHGITFTSVSQALPGKWIQWLDAPASPTSVENNGLPDKIAEIVNSGGVDPREWVAEWVEEVLSLGVGVVAQRYVARRMGVGLGGIGRGKAREEVVLESGAAEAARVI